MVTFTCSDCHAVCPHCLLRTQPQCRLCRPDIESSSHPHIKGSFNILLASLASRRERVKQSSADHSPRSEKSTIAKMLKSSAVTCRVPCHPHVRTARPFVSLVVSFVVSSLLTVMTTGVSRNSSTFARVADVHIVPLVTLTSESTLISQSHNIYKLKLSENSR